MKNKVFSLEDFNTAVNEDSDFRDTVSNKSDIIDLDNGVMRIHSKNVGKYLEKYACKDADDLEKTLYYSYGIYCEVI